MYTKTKKLLNISYNVHIIHICRCHLQNYAVWLKVQYFDSFWAQSNISNHPNHPSIHLENCVMCKQFSAEVLE